MEIPASRGGSYLFPAGTGRSSSSDQIRRPGGASLSELKKATGWQAHSVRGFLSGVLKKKRDLHLRSASRDNAERAYRLASK